VWLAREIADGRWRRAAIAGATVLAIGVISAHLLPTAERQSRYRPDEFFMAARAYYERGDQRHAYDELESALDHAYAGPDQPTLPARYENLIALPFVRVAHELGRDADAATVLERLATVYPKDAGVEQLLGFVYRDGLGKADEGQRHFARAETLGAESLGTP